MNNIKIPTQTLNEASFTFLTVLHKDGTLIYQIMKSTKVATKEILTKVEFDSIVKKYYPELLESDKLEFEFKNTEN